MPWGLITLDNDFSWLEMLDSLYHLFSRVLPMILKCRPLGLPFSSPTTLEADASISSQATVTCITSADYHFQPEGHAGLDHHNINNNVKCQNRKQDDDSKKELDRQNLTNKIKKNLKRVIRVVCTIICICRERIPITSVQYGVYVRHYDDIRGAALLLGNHSTETRY